ncbi:hypothetical protein MPER_11886, partial [Moniliophthora perniciosa FA553]
MSLLKLAVLPLLLLAHSTIGQLGLPNGFLTFTTPSFNVQLVKDSQTLYSLKPRTGGGPDFIPADKMTQRQNNRQYHLGDITFRARTVGSSAWVSGDSAASRRAVTARTASGNTLASANLGPTLPSNSLLNITRRWVVDGDQFELLFDVTNSQNTAVEIGALGAPLEFNNIFSDRDAAATNTLCSVFDPYIGQDAGYVQVTPLLGTLPPLVVLPVGKSPLEGWRFLPESTSGAPFYQSQTFEGLYEWQFHTLAYAQNEWSQVKLGHMGFSFGLHPLSAELTKLSTSNRPVAVTVPGTILPTDQTGKLFLHAPSAVQSISVSPSGALSWATNSEAKSAGWVGYSITARTWGRARLSITYADGSVQTVHYYVTKAATQTLGDLGNFLTTAQWYTNTADPFKRAPSVISYDREVNSYVLNDPRVWISGLEDEGGAGAWLAALMKQFAQPNAAEVTKLQQFIAQTLSKTIQNSDGSVKK